jgi:hypothetical protein
MKNSRFVIYSCDIDVDHSPARLVENDALHICYFAVDDIDDNGPFGPALSNASPL